MYIQCFRTGELSKSTIGQLMLEHFVPQAASRVALLDSLRGAHHEALGPKHYPRPRKKVYGCVRGTAHHPLRKIRHAKYSRVEGNNNNDRSFLNEQGVIENVQIPIDYSVRPAHRTAVSGKNSFFHGQRKPASGLTVNALDFPLDRIFVHNCRIPYQLRAYTSKAGGSPYTNFVSTLVYGVYSQA